MTPWRPAAIVPDSIVKQPARPLARASSSVLFVEAPVSPVVRLNVLTLEREGVARHLTLPLPCGAHPFDGMRRAKRRATKRRHHGAGPRFRRLIRFRG